MKLWKKVDCLLIGNFHDCWKDPLISKYLGEEAAKSFEGILIISRNEKALWISHPFNYTQAKKKFKNKIKVLTYHSIKDLKKILTKNTGKFIGYNSKHQTVKSFNSLKQFLRGKKFIDVELELSEIRENKNSFEIENIRCATRETKKVINLAKKWVKKGITEKQLEEKIKKQIIRDGFDVAFCIVAFDENTTHIHHVATNKKLSFGPVMIDLGAKFNGYCADLTETFFFGENNTNTKHSKKLKEFIKTKKLVQKVVNKIESILKPGQKSKELWKASKILGKAKHALGHGIGLEVHDYPQKIDEKTNFILKEGMVLAIEPALYNKKFGVRIENDYLITKKGFEKLE